MKKIITGIVILVLFNGCAGMLDLIGDMEASRTYDSFDPYHDRLKTIGDTVDYQSSAIDRSKGENIENAILANDIVIGMTPAQVMASWGDPTFIEVAGNGTSGNEKWVYGSKHSLSNRRVIIFENGRVAGWYR